MKSRDMLVKSIDETVIYLAWQEFTVFCSYKLCGCLYLQYKISLLIDYSCFICRKDFYHEDNYIAVHGCLLRDGMSMGKITKAFSYSFNVFHVSHSSVEGGTEFLIKLLE